MDAHRMLLKHKISVRAAQDDSCVLLKLVKCLATFHEHPYLNGRKPTMNQLLYNNDIIL